MPFPIEPKYIRETEQNLEVKFPPLYKNKMMLDNGGTLFLDDFEIELYPFFDKSNKKRISRTCNHIELQNANMWSRFPKNAISISSNDADQFVLLRNGNGILNEEIYFWDHEISTLTKIANSILEFED